MSRLLRIGQTLLRARRRPAVAVADETELSLQVWPNEADWRYVHQAIYPLYLELGRWDYVVRCGWARQIWKQRISIQLGSQILRYYRPLRRFQRFEVRTRIVGWDAKWTYLEQRISSAGELYTLGCVRAICIDGQRNKLAPASFVDTLGSVQTAPMSRHAELLAEFGELTASPRAPVARASQ